MENIGLVLEGGGMRGIYTTGVLDFFMEKNLYFPYIVGVSMGACNGISYVSRQKGRNKKININYIDDPRYLSCKNWIARKGIFNGEFIFDEIPNKLDLFDTEAFNKAKEEFIVVATNCDTGKPVYFEKDKYKNDILDIVKASSSLPFVAPIVKYKGTSLLDGGISDPIPVKKSIKDGNNKNVIILTRNKGYVKKPFKMKFMANRIYSRYKGLIRCMENRYIKYNSTVEYIERLEKQGKVFVIRPKQTIKVRRIERNKEKLEELYKQGYVEAKDCYDKLIEWMEQ